MFYLDVFYNYSFNYYGVNMKVALIGTSNCGKTTLINDIHKQKVFKNHNVILEVAGGFTKTERKQLSTQIKIIKKQIQIEEEYTNFISDRSVMDNLAYFMYHYRNAPSKKLFAKAHDEYMSYFNYHMINKPYDAVIFIDDYFDLEDNGIREMDTEMQDWVYTYLTQMVPIWCDIYGIPLYVISGTPQERIKEVKRVLKPHYAQKRVSDYVG